MCDKKSIQNGYIREPHNKYCPLCNKICNNGTIRFFDNNFPCIAHYKLPNGEVYCTQFKENFEEYK
jgi:hypothetical protein